MKPEVAVAETTAVGLPAGKINAEDKGWSQVDEKAPQLSTRLVNDKTRTLWIGELQHWMDEAYIQSCFAFACQVQSCNLIRHKKTGASRRYGFIEFTTRQAAEDALAQCSGTLMPSTQQVFSLNWASSGVGERRHDDGQGGAEQPLINPEAKKADPSSVEATNNDVMQSADDQQQKEDTKDMKGSVLQGQPSHMSSTAPEAPNESTTQDETTKHETNDQIKAKAPGQSAEPPKAPEDGNQLEAIMQEFLETLEFGSGLAPPTMPPLSGRPGKSRPPKKGRSTGRGGRKPARMIPPSGLPFLQAIQEESESPEEWSPGKKRAFVHGAKRQKSHCGDPVKRAALKDTANVMRRGTLEESGSFPRGNRDSVFRKLWQDEGVLSKKAEPPEGVVARILSKRGYPGIPKGAKNENEKELWPPSLRVEISSVASALGDDQLEELVGSCESLLWGDMDAGSLLVGSEKAESPKPSEEHKQTVEEKEPTSSPKEGEGQVDDRLDEARVVGPPTPNSMGVLEAVGVMYSSVPSSPVESTVTKDSAESAGQGAESSVTKEDAKSAAQAEPAGLLSQQESLKSAGSSGCPTPLSGKSTDTEDAKAALQKIQTLISTRRVSKEDVLKLFGDGEESPEWPLSDPEAGSLSKSASCATLSSEEGKEPLEVPQGHEVQEDSLPLVVDEVIWPILSRDAALHDEDDSASGLSQNSDSEDIKGVISEGRQGAHSPAPPSPPLRNALSLPILRVPDTQADQEDDSPRSPFALRRFGAAQALSPNPKRSPSSSKALESPQPQSHGAVVTQGSSPNTGKRGRELDVIESHWTKEGWGLADEAPQSEVAVVPEPAQAKELASFVEHVGPNKDEERVLEGVEAGGAPLDDVPDDAFVPEGVVHEPPKLVVTQSKGSWLQLDCRFSVSLPPEGVFTIVTDPNNRRVFKNIKEVLYRKVIQDCGDWRLVEVEQTARWRFLVFHGNFRIRTYVAEDRRTLSTSYELAEQGFMKQFEGTWKIDPMYADELDNDGRPPKANKARAKANTDPDERGPVIGSWITLHQTLQPSVSLPWPLSHYAKGVVSKIAKDMLGDLQREAMRINARNAAKASASATPTRF